MHACLQTPAAWLLRALLLPALFLACFPPGHQSEDGQLVWWLLVKLLICCVLGACAHLLKTLLAKLMASNFHKRAHLDKIQDALNKVRGPRSAWSRFRVEGPATLTLNAGLHCFAGLVRGCQASIRRHFGYRALGFVIAWLPWPLGHGLRC